MIALPEEEQQEYQNLKSEERMRKQRHI